MSPQQPSSSGRSGEAAAAAAAEIPPLVQAGALVRSLLDVAKCTASLSTAPHDTHTPLRATNRLPLRRRCYGWHGGGGSGRRHLGAEAALLPDAPHPHRHSGHDAGTVRDWRGLHPGAVPHPSHLRAPRAPASAVALSGGVCSSSGVCSGVCSSEQQQRESAAENVAALSVCECCGVGPED